MLTINVEVLLAFIVVMRLRRRTEARSRMDERFTVVIVLALGVLIAPTELGQGILNILTQLVQGISDSDRARASRTPDAQPAHRPLEPQEPGRFTVGPVHPR
ncbi:hypothetical protein ACIBCU_38105 [Streptomyces sp. NPDC051064]|uniref:hypothetical protein n=1 Tax=Streptomyces sp. NPDC051064 TaxID=3365641 RepID=UPI0037BBD2A0